VTEDLLIRPLTPVFSQNYTFHVPLGRVGANNRIRTRTRLTDRRDSDAIFFVFPTKMNISKVSFITLPIKLIIVFFVQSFNRLNKDIAPLVVLLPK